MLSSSTASRSAAAANKPTAENQGEQGYHTADLTDQLKKRGIVGSFKEVIIGSDNVSENVSGGALSHVSALLRRSFKDNKSSKGSEIKESEGEQEKAEEEPEGVLLVKEKRQQEC